MVYIIRNKGFWEYAAGARHYDRNFHNFIKPMEPPKEQTLFISRKNISYFPFRYLHVYRTLKRAGNQFFQGNELLQNTFTLALRSMYLRVPEEMFTERYGGIEMLVHKGERHWELMTYNQHPLQHDIYEIFNQYCHHEHGKKLSGEEQKLEEMFARFEEVLTDKKEKAGLKKHETLDMEDLREAFDKVLQEEREDSGSSLYVKSQEQKDKEFDETNPKRVSFFY